MRNTVKRPGQRRWSNPYHPQRQREARMKDGELASYHKGESEAQKEISSDLKSLSNKHKQHGEALGDVDRAAKELEKPLREAMKDPRYTGQRAEGVDHAYVAWVTSEFKKIYPDKELGDRDLNPSSGHRLG